MLPPEPADGVTV
jgi:hypothetical protein